MLLSRTMAPTFASQLASMVLFLAAPATNTGKIHGALGPCQRASLKEDPPPPLSRQPDLVHADSAVALPPWKNVHSTVQNGMVEACIPWVRYSTPCAEGEGGCHLDLICGPGTEEGSAACSTTAPIDHEKSSKEPHHVHHPAGPLPALASCHHFERPGLRTAGLCIHRRSRHLRRH
ncbi:hypothetical protein GQ53DRAFT_123187 [Thozetella sp. PMI_491]|nr:hypothetical protein GQ53DRAFT_123187 [Thozetella sp. PMI_491]